MGEHNSVGHNADSTAILSPDMIEVVKFVPPPALAPFVTQIYFFRCDQERVCDMQPAAPGHLVFLLKGSGTMRFQDGHVDAVTKASVIGPGLAAAEFQIDGPLHDLGFALSPLGFVALTGRPANHYVDRAVPASALFGPEIDVLTKKLMAGHTDGTMRLAQMVDEITAFLLSRLKTVPTSHVNLVHTVISWLSGEFDPDVEQLYAQIEMSRSTTVRLITKYFGTAPKQLMRKYRALRAATIMVDSRASSEMRAQVESIFYDQPHMIREIRQFAGRTPGALDSDDAKVMRLWLNKDNFRDIESFLA
ncbi:helix-turn-helix domain-containing protein [Sphingorhabdus sp.]|uniref:helix-turn-helix domain-containing protein n=1 Tax=Sphingorhabdus sp. TaxID=1902408 RepID=UPI00391B24A5